MAIEEFKQQNIEKVTVKSRLNGAMYMIVANDGYRILTPENIITDEEGNVTRTDKKAVILRANYNWDTIEIHETENNEETIN